MSSSGAIERRVLAEISQSVENRDCAHGIVQRIVGSTPRITGNKRRKGWIAIDSLKHVDSIRTRHGRPKVSRRVEIALRDAMNRASEAQRVIVAIGSAAVVASEEVALNRLPGA